MSICLLYQRANEQKDLNAVTWGGAAPKPDGSWYGCARLDYQETVWETVVTGRTAESLSILKEAIAGAEQLLGLAGEDEQARGKRAQTELRLDSGWGGEAMITWLLSRGYQVTGKFKSNSRVRKLIRGITDWLPTSSPGREVAMIPEPVSFARPLAQYAVRTPSKEQESGYYHAVLFTSRSDLSMKEVVEHYDGRAGMEANLKSDKQGLAVCRREASTACRPRVSNGRLCT